MATPTALPATFTASTVLPASDLNLLRGAFRILQVVQSADVATVLTSSSATYVTTGVTLSITPQYTTSKILCLYSIQTYTSAASTGLGLQLKRGSTAIVSDIDNCFGTSGGLQIMTTLWGIDSPTTTAATSYTVFFNRNSGAGTANINASTQGVSRMFAMEISA